MHVRGFQATTSSMVADLPVDPERPARVWAALGSPCTSVFVPFVVPPPGYEGPAALPPLLSDDEVAKRFSALRGAVEDAPGVLERVRAGLDTTESELWAEADSLGYDMSGWEMFAGTASDRTVVALTGLASTGLASGLGTTAPA
jgi:hypothetical protein